MIGALVLLCAGEQAAVQAQAPNQEQGIARTLTALEERSYAAWKSGDAKFLRGFLSNKFVGWGPSGRLDRTAALKVLSGAGCRIANYRLSKAELSRPTPDTAVLTHRIDVEGACDGKRLAPSSYVATVYVQEGDRWKAAFRAQSVIVDPLKATKPAASEVWTGGPTRSDAATQALFSRENEVWTAWKDHNAKRLDKLLGSNIQFIDIFGDHIATRADAIKAWSGEGCAVSRFDITGAKATMLSPNLGILTFRATAQGKCFGQQVWPVWGSSLYVKQGNAWMWTFGVNLLAGRGW